MADIALSVASKVAEYLVAPVGRRCGYMIFSNSYVCQLTDEVEKLGDARDRVQHSINEARNNMKLIEADVERWAKDAETVANKTRDMLEHDGRVKKTCFFGWFPNPKARYCLGKEARRTVEDIQALIARSQFRKVYYENAPPGLVDGAPDVSSSVGGQGDTIIESRASILEDILNALDDEKLKVIGIYGPGGVGKTTLLEEIQKKLRNEKRLFHLIAPTTVSQTPDLKKIQDDIAYALSLDLKNESSEVGRRDLLFRKLQSDPTKRVLIILDDLWGALDLKAVGIPSGDKSKGCKLLLASRYNDVLQEKMHADRTFLLDGLNNDEAFKLFEKTIGDRLKSDEELKPIATQVVKKLAGLPLLITSVASTLKYSNVSAWRNALIKIEESNIESIVKLSYDHLKSEHAKSLFLLCGLIGGTIQVEFLLGLGMGLGLFEEFNNTIEDSRDRLNTMLDSLRSICLLQVGGDGKDNVTIHDLYSEVVIRTPFRDQNSVMMTSHYGLWPKEKLERCWAICLVDVGSDRLAELMSCRFPDLKILMLSQPGSLFGMPDHRHDVVDCCRLEFTYMKELRVLYLQSMDIPILPSSIGILENLQSLYLNLCIVEDVAALGKLKALQILSLAGSVISKLPQEIGHLTNLRSLDLTCCSDLEIIEPGVLKGLINLEELHMQGSFDQWTGKYEITSESCNARLTELKSLTKLTSLEISISDPFMLLEDDDLSFENLIRFWINIGNATGRTFEGLRTFKLKSEGCDSILSRGWVQKTLYKTQHLHLDGLRESKENAHELCIQGFPQLKHFAIESSPSIKYITGPSHGAFTILESLLLRNLVNLEKICHGLVAPECFSKLKSVSVTKCDQLKHLWCLSQMQSLEQLEEIVVWHCDSMRAIVTDDDGTDIVAADNRVELPNVRRLSLRELPNMTSFCIGAGITLEGTPIQVSFPRLESLEMVGLLDLEKILYSQSPLEYINLESIEIRESQSTSSILKSDLILKLPNLKSMKIKSSQSTKVVFDLEELTVTGHVEILSQLETLTLRKLPNVHRMWKHDVKLQGISAFRNLEKLEVSDTGLAFLFPLSVAKCLRVIRDIRVDDCPNMKAVIMDEEGRDEGTDDIIELPLLERLSIRSCPTEKFFSYPYGKKESISTTSDSQDAYSDSFFDRKVSLPSLKELELQYVRSLKRIWNDEPPRSSFCDLATLSLESCYDLLHIFPSTIIGRLHNLKRVEVSSCPDLESLFDCGSLDSNTEQTRVLLPDLVSVFVFYCDSLESLFDCGSLDSNTELLLPKLEEVKVMLAGRLRHMVKSEAQTVMAFPSLNFVEVEACSDLTYLFPNHTATTLENLERLWITSCGQMKEVVPKEEGGRSKADVMSFPSLSELRLDGLFSLISFSSGSCSYDFAALEYLVISRCRNFGAFIPSPTSFAMRPGETAKEDDDESPQPLFNEMVTFPNLRKLKIGRVQCKELWNNRIPNDSFCNLESLKLEHCNNLQRIAPSHMWKRLQRCLEILKVSSCHSIKTIYETDGSTDTRNGQLRSLHLYHLKNLRHVWQSDGLPNIPFPNLRFIEAWRCSRLETLFPTFTAEFLGQIEELVVGSCEDMELIAGREEREEANGTTMTFSELTALRLYDLPKFRRFLPEKYCAEFPSLEVFRRVSCGTEPDQSFGDEEEREEESEESVEEIEEESEESVEEIEEESEESEGDEGEDSVS